MTAERRSAPTRHHHNRRNIVRIIAGTSRGRKLATPARGRTIRPTTDRVRESLFGIITSRKDIQDAHVLDIFAGTGAVGCEALSRGAASVVFVDRSRSSFKIILENLRRIQKPREEILIGDALTTVKSLKPTRKFDIVFLDPPYGEQLVEPIALELDKAKLLAPGAWVIAEHNHKETIPQELQQLELLMERTYGDTRITIWELPEEEPTP